MLLYKVRFSILKGSNFDKDGNRFLWWDKLEDFAFQEKAMCIITQYDNYTMDDGMQVSIHFNHMR